MAVRLIDRSQLPRLMHGGTLLHFAWLQELKRCGHPAAQLIDVQAMLEQQREAPPPDGS